MKWFGKSWGAPVCTPADFVLTPVGAPCLRCEKPITESDSGFIVPYLSEFTGQGPFQAVPFHYECFMESIFGKEK